MYSYRIHTEFKNIDAIVEEAAKRFPACCATFTSCLGLWRGKEERSLTIEFIDEWSASYQVATFAHWIKGYNRQEAVLVTATHLDLHILA